MKEKGKDALLLTVGTWMTAVGIYFFKFPNHFSTGGVSGISVILSALLPQVSTGTLVLLINMLLLLIGFFVFGRSFGLKTAYCSTLLSLTIFALERLVPMAQPLTEEPMLELCFSVLLPAVGSAMLFNRHSSTGGTDIVAMIIKKYTHADIGKALFCTDFLIATMAGVVFGIQTGLFSLLGLLAKALVVDSVIENMNLSKYFTIVTSDPAPIVEFIKSTLKRSATLLDAHGAYTQQNQTVILTVLSRSQAVRLRLYIHKVDPKAFLILSNSSEIIGKGFRQTI